MKHRTWMTFCLLALALCLLAGTACGEETTDDVQIAVVNTKSSPLGLRETPEQNGKTILEIKKNEKVVILEDGDWPLVEYNGQRGYVNGQYLKYQETNESKYAKALAWQKDNLFDKALEAYRELGDYKDAPHRLEVMEAAKLYPMRKNKQYGLVNSTGRWFVAPQWDFVTEARYALDNCYVFKTYDGEMIKTAAGTPMVPSGQKGKWGLIDFQGNELIPCIWDSIEDINEGYIFCYNTIGEKKNYTLYHYDGKTVTILAENYSYLGDMAEGYILFEKDEKWGFLNQDGEQWGPTYTDACMFSDGLAAVQIDGKYGFIDTEGEFILQPTWEKATFFSCGLCSASEENKWGYIDRQGNWVIAPQFDGAYRFQREYDRAIVEKNGKQFLIDKTGKQIGSKWDKVYAFNREDETAIVESNGKRGLIDKNGNVMISAKQEDVRHAMDGIIYCRDSSGNNHYRSVDGKLHLDDKTIGKKLKLTGDGYFSSYTYFDHPVMYTNAEMFILNMDGSVFLREREQ